MQTMTFDILASMAESLKGKRVDVSETGYTAQGLVKRIKVTTSYAEVVYVSGPKLAVHRFGGSRNWASVHLKDDNTLVMSVPMIGRVTIYQETP